MAPRRLLILMLVLLGISSVIAVLIPSPRRDEREREAREAAALVNGDDGTDGRDTAATGADGDDDETAGPGRAEPRQENEKRAGGDLPAGMSVDRDTGLYRLTLGPSGKHRVLTVPGGSRLVLTVKADQPSGIVIPGLGRDGFADRWAPAVFDLLLPGEPGRYPVKSVPVAGGKPATEAVIVTTARD